MRPNDYDNFLVNIRCSDEFRERMEKCLSTESGEMSSGEKDIKIVKAPSKFRAGNIAAMAAAIAIVFGAGIAVNHLLSGSGEGPFLPGGDAEVTEEPEITEAVTEAEDEGKSEVTETVTEKITETKESSDADVPEMLNRIYSEMTEFLEKDGFMNCYGCKGRIGYSIYGPPYSFITRYYNVTDPEELITEITSLKSWKQCSADEYESGTTTDEEQMTYVQKYDLYYDAKHKSCELSENGYMSYDFYKLSGPEHFKLEDEAEIEKLNDILAKNLVFTPESELAEKIHNGMYNFSNLKGEFSWEQSFEEEGNEISYSYHANGTIAFSADDELMYMTGEEDTAKANGEPLNDTFEIIMNGENSTAYSVVNNETGEIEYEGAYSYPWNNMEYPFPYYHYIYLCRNIEDVLSGPIVISSNRVNIDEDGIFVQKIEDGITEYHWNGRYGNGGEKLQQYTIWITDGGQIVFYEKTDGNYCETFMLEKYEYEFDSDSFEMDTAEIKAKYDVCKAAQLEKYNYNVAEE